MCIADSREPTKKNGEKKLTDMLRKEREWNHIKCSAITIKNRKRVEDEK